MSRHIYETQYNGRPVTVLCGWDRPLGGYFLSVRLSDNQQSLVDEDDEFVFDSLDYGNGHEPTIEPFLNVLSNLNIHLPKPMIDSLIEDRIINEGNVEVRHVVNSDGAYETLLDS